MFWNVVASYEGYDPVFDKRLERAVSRECSGSGFGLMDGMRDINWRCRDETKAREVAVRLRRFKRVTSVSVDHLDEYGLLVDEPGT